MDVNEVSDDGEEGSDNDGPNKELPGDCHRPNQDLSEEDYDRETLEDDSNEMGKEDLFGRPYQIQIFEQAKKKNLIVYLGTGTGKTFIAVLLIKEYASQIANKSWNDGAKRSIFLANTVPLVIQQMNYISQHTPLKVNSYYGATTENQWVKEKWEQEFKKYHVLVMSSQILLDLLIHGFLPLDRINLIILDECHHAVSSHPMREIMQYIGESKIPLKERPRILGLTAAVINKKINVVLVKEKVRDLELTMNAELVTADNDDTNKYCSQPKNVMIEYNPPESESFYLRMKTTIDQVTTALRYCKVVGPTSQERKHNRKFIKNSPLQAINMFTEISSQLGPWCTLAFLDFIKPELEELMKPLKKGGIFYSGFKLVSVYFDKARKYLEETMSGKDLHSHLLELSTDKLVKLVQILRSAACLQSPESNFCGIIFVQKRITAKVLNRYLKTLCAMDSSLAYLSVHWVVGNNNENPLVRTKAEGIDSSNQNEILNIKIPQAYSSKSYPNRH